MGIQFLLSLVQETYQIGEKLEKNRFSKEQILIKQQVLMELYRLYLKIMAG